MRVRAWLGYAKHVGIRAERESVEKAFKCNTFKTTRTHCMHVGTWLEYAKHTSSNELAINFTFYFAQDWRTEKSKRFSVEGKQRLSILLCNVHFVHRTYKVSFSPRTTIPFPGSERGPGYEIGCTTEYDGRHAVISVHSIEQLLHLIIKTLVLCRSRCHSLPRISSSLIKEDSGECNEKSNPLIKQ